MVQELSGQGLEQGRAEHPPSYWAEPCMNTVKKVQDSQKFRNTVKSDNNEPGLFRAHFFYRMLI